MTRLFRQFVALVLWATMSTPTLVERGFACAMPTSDVTAPAVAVAGAMSGMDMGDMDMADMGMTDMAASTSSVDDTNVPYDA